MEGPSAAQGLRHPQAGHRLGAREPGDRERTVAMDQPNVTTTVLGADEIILNMGPQHPSTHGVLRVKLKLDGEKVIGSECIIGYLHRGVEKIGENRTYPQFAPYVDRTDYVAAVSNGLGYCEAVEKLLGVEAPPRARWVRTILTELQRIASHLLWLGTHALDIGALTPVFYTFREREEVLKIFERYCGARLTTHAFRIGGLQYETYDGFEEEVKAFCRDFEKKVVEYEELLTENRIWVQRTRNVGILPPQDAIEMGAPGPGGRPPPELNPPRGTSATTSSATAPRTPPACASARRRSSTWKPSTRW